MLIRCFAIILALNSAKLPGFPKLLYSMSSDLIIEPTLINIPKKAPEPKIYWPSVLTTPFGAPFFKIAYPPKTNPETAPTVVYIYFKCVYKIWYVCNNIC